MSDALHAWIETAHLFGVILWIAGLIACLQLLRAHASGGGSAAAETARSTALLMDLGAALAIAAGLTMALAVEPSPFREGWLHAKLTFVVLGMLSLHGITRAKIKKARRGETSSLAAWPLPAALALVALIVTLAVAKPM
jgi:protoporphyrinogen IX oxidase